MLEQCEELKPMGKTHTEIHGESSPMGGTPYWSRERTPFPEREVVGETTCHELLVTLIPCLPEALEQLHPGKEALFCFSLSYSDFHW